MCQSLIGGKKLVFSALTGQIYIYGHKFPTNRYVGSFLQLTYKIDMCLLACEKHMLFK
jgi:hypothetical protein